jgi:hypothetical protein
MAGNDGDEVHRASADLQYQTGLGFGNAATSAQPKSRERANTPVQRRETVSRERTCRRDQERRASQEGIRPVVTPTELGHRNGALGMHMAAADRPPEAAHLRGMRSRTLSVAGKGSCAVLGAVGETLTHATNKQPRRTGTGGTPENCLSQVQEARSRATANTRQQCHGEALRPPRKVNFHCRCSSHRPTMKSHVTAHPP